MATCKECLHVEACEFISQIQEKHMNDFFNEQGKEISVKFRLPDAEKCLYFKDRSRLMVLPFQIGDDVYCTRMFKIYKKTVKKIELDDEGIAIVTEDGYCIDSTICFRSQKEAEQALKEREENA